MTTVDAKSVSPATNAQHTPGQWFFDKDEPEFTISSDHGQMIARAFSADDFPCLEEGTEDHMNDEARANARLIAAAPDLWKAALCQEMAELAQANCEDCAGEVQPELCGTCFPLFDKARVTRRLAIAKAEGREP